MKRGAVPLQSKAKGSGPVDQDRSRGEAESSCCPGGSFGDISVFPRRESAINTATSLPTPLRRKMESAFHSDFSDVRLHTDAPRADSMSALAFTQGRDIHFAPGQYNPNSQEGQKIIAHELTHVVQQRQGRVAVPQGGNEPVISSPELETEADFMGARAVQGESLKLPQTQPSSSARSQPLSGTPVQGMMAHGGGGGGVAPGRIRNQDDMDALYQYSLRNEQMTRDMIPHAGNQITDLQADPEALSRHEDTRFMNRTVLGGDPGADGLRDTLATAMSAARYQGGMCNEYSATSFAHHMASPEVSGWPIVRWWNPDMHHSFTSIGDSRDPTMPMVVPDAWTTDRDPQLAENTAMWRGQNDLGNVVSLWQDRMPGEGQQVVNDAARETTDLFERAEGDPMLQDQRRRLWDVNRQSQQDTLENLRMGHREDWLFHHPTNRRG